MKYITIFVLALTIISCKNDKKNDELKSNATELKTDSLPEISTIVDNSSEIETIKRPEKTIIRNLTVDTTKVFGVWAQDSNDMNADFLLTSESFYVADYDGDGNMPYILDENKITIFFEEAIREGIITSTENNKLKIKWSDLDQETEYVRFE